MLIRYRYFYSNNTAQLSIFFKAKLMVHYSVVRHTRAVFHTLSTPCFLSLQNRGRQVGLWQVDDDGQIKNLFFPKIFTMNTALGEVHCIFYTYFFQKCYYQGWTHASFHFFSLLSPDSPLGTERGVCKTQQSQTKETKKCYFHDLCHATCGHKNTFKTTHWDKARHNTAT